MVLRAFALVYLFFIAAFAFADGGGQCRFLFAENPTVTERDYEQQLFEGFREEWGFVKKTLAEKNIGYEIQQSFGGPVIVFTVKGNHSVNRFAKDLLDKYGAKLIYEVGVEHPRFLSDMTKDGIIKNLYVSIPASLVDLPFSVARTYGVLHELRHLVGYIAAYKGQDLPYYGYFRSSEASLPSRQSRPLSQRHRDLDHVYRDLSVDEIRTYFSTVYQQALKISRRLKQKDMTSLELKERMEQLLTDVEVMYILSDKIQFNLSGLKTALEQGARASTMPSKLGDESVYYSLIAFRVSGVEVFYESPLPLLKTNQSLRANHAMLERQVTWSLEVASRITEALNPLVRDPNEAKDFGPSLARQYVDQLLTVINPTFRRSLEVSTSN